MMENMFVIAFLAALIGGLIFSFGRLSRIEFLSVLAYAGASFGVIYSNNEQEFFYYWEAMAIASTVLIACGGNIAATLRYATLHFAGGAILVIGLITNIWQLELLGIAINAAVIPFSAWVADSYSSARPHASIFLSSFTTKIAILALVIMSADIILFAPIVGMLMIFYGLIYALISDNIRKILSYSIVNQLGFMLVGLSYADATFAVSAQAFGHIIYKASLFMIAAVLIIKAGKVNLSDKFAISNKFLFYIAIFFALSIMAAPFTIGFTGKVLISALAVEDSVIYALLTIASVGTVIYISRLVYYVFVAYGAKKTIKLSSTEIIGLSFMAVIASYYSFIDGLTLYAIGTTFKHIAIIVVGIAVFYFSRKALIPRAGDRADIDIIYRKIIPTILIKLGDIIAIIYNMLAKYMDNLRAKLLNLIKYLFMHDGVFARSWTLSSIVALILILFLIVLNV